MTCRQANNNTHIYLITVQRNEKQGCLLSYITDPPCFCAYNHQVCLSACCPCEQSWSARFACSHSLYISFVSCQHPTPSRATLVLCDVIRSLFPNTKVYCDHISHTDNRNSTLANIHLGDLSSNCKNSKAEVKFHTGCELRA